MDDTIEKKELKRLIRRLRIDVNLQLINYDQVRREIAYCDKKLSKLDMERAKSPLTPENSEYIALSEKKASLEERENEIIADLDSFKHLVVSKRPQTRLAKKVAKREGYVSPEGYIYDNTEYNRNIINNALGHDSNYSSQQEAYFIARIPDRIVNKVSKKCK